MLSVVKSSVLALPPKPSSAWDTRTGQAVPREGLALGDMNHTLLWWYPDLPLWGDGLIHELACGCEPPSPPRHVPAGGCRPADKCTTGRDSSSPGFFPVGLAQLSPLLGHHPALSQSLSEFSSATSPAAAANHLRAGSASSHRLAGAQAASGWGAKNTVFSPNCWGGASRPDFPYKAGMSVSRSLFQQELMLCYCFASF